MVSLRKFLSLAVVLAAMAALVACENSTDDPPPPPPPPGDTAQLNFEGTQFSTWNTAGNYYFDDDNTVQGGSQAITFAQDDLAFAGESSLQISGTMRQNKHGADYISDARIYLQADKSVVDFSTGTITAHFYVQSGTVDNVQVILNDSSYQPCQGKYTASTASGAWQTVTFTPSDAAQVNWKSDTFNIAQVAFMEVRVSNTTAPADAAVVWNVDSISW